MQFILLSVAFLTKNALSESTSWDYEHMDTWKDTYPFCGAVDESPINIDTKSIITLADDERCSLPFQWDIDTTVNTFKIKNNGHSVSLYAVEEPSTTNGEWTTLSSNTNVIARFPNYFRDSLIPEYCLDAVHFHWGLDSFTGSEHKVDGKQYPLEVHFVHFNCDRLNLEETLDAYPDFDAVDEGDDEGDVHELAVVSVFFEASDTKTNPEFDELFGGDEKTVEFIQYAYEEHSAASAEYSAPEDGEIVTGNLEALLPGNLRTEGYYSYEGSLTTPPCTNIVRWYVMKATGIIGEEQLNEYFRPLQNEYFAEVDDFIAPNFRDIQGQNVNPVYECSASSAHGEEDDGTIIVFAAFGVVQVVIALIALWFVIGYLIRFRKYFIHQKIIVFSVIGCLLLAFVEGCVRSLVLTNVIVHGVKNILEFRCNGLFWHQIYILQLNQLLMYIYLLSRLKSLQVLETAMYYFLLTVVSCTTIFTTVILPWYNIPTIYIGEGDHNPQLMMCANGEASDDNLYEEYAWFLAVDAAAQFVLLFVFLYHFYRLCTECGCCTCGRNKFTYRILGFAIIVVLLNLAEFIYFSITENTFHAVRFIIYSILILSSFRLCAVAEDSDEFIDSTWCWCWCCIEDKVYSKVSTVMQEEEESSNVGRIKKDDSIGLI